MWQPEGEKSGEYGARVIPFLSIYWLIASVMLAVWGRALSCCAET